MIRLGFTPLFLIERSKKRSIKTDLNADLLEMGTLHYVLQFEIMITQGS